MNKTGLVDAVATETTGTKKDAEAAVDAVFRAISQSLARGEEVSVHGFGIFEVVDRPERDGRNPQTGEAIKIAASKSPKFKPAKQLKSLVAAPSA